MDEFASIISQNFTQMEADSSTVAAFAVSAPYDAEKHLAAETEAYLEGYAEPARKTANGNAHVRRMLNNPYL
jgi:hypothetical protein